VGRYEREAYNKGREYESVESLTRLGQQLCREIARYEARINYAVLIAEDPDTSSMPPTPPKKPVFH
jgi:hypothetical protein